MEGEQRRQEILKLFKETKKPISGSALAKKMGVSRQVIVQDIALLRAVNKNILSTNRGYILYDEDADKGIKSVVAVRHTDEEMREELYTVVDAGARVLDVIIEHEVYGQITVDLLLTSRRDVDEFIEKIMSDTVKPLKILTNDVHYHTIEADKKEILDSVEDALREKGYLMELA